MVSVQVFGFRLQGFGVWVGDTAPDEREGLYFFFFIALGLELSDEKVYEP
jgi:hypothetical protein